MPKKDMTLTDAYKLMFVDYPDVVAVPQLCEMLGGIGRKEAYKLLHSGKIEYLNDGKGFKIPKICVLAYLLNERFCSACGATYLECFRKFSNTKVNKGGIKMRYVERNHYAERHCSKQKWYVLHRNKLRR